MSRRLVISKARSDGTQRRFERRRDGRRARCVESRSQGVSRTDELDGVDEFFLGQRQQDHVFDKQRNRPEVAIVLVRLQGLEEFITGFAGVAETHPGVAKIVMTDCDHPAVPDLAGEAHRFFEAHLGDGEVALQLRDHSEVVLRDADGPAVPQLFAYRQGAFVHRARLVEIAFAFGDQTEVAQEAADACPVVEPLAELEALFVRGARRIVVPLL